MCFLQSGNPKDLIWADRKLLQHRDERLDPRHPVTKSREKKKKSVAGTSGVLPSVTKEEKFAPTPELLSEDEEELGTGKFAPTPELLSDDTSFEGEDTDTSEMVTSFNVLL